MARFIQPAGGNDGGGIPCVAPTGGVVAGTIYQLGQMPVLARETVAQTLQFTGVPLVAGAVYSVPKIGSQAWTEGQVIYWDKENSRATSVATGSFRLGWAVIPVPGSGAGETLGNVLVNITPVADEA